MHTDHDLKTLSVEDFAKQSELAGRTLIGWIRYDATAPDVIYYGVTPVGCPQHPIPKGSIETLQLFGGEGIPCHGGGLLRSGEPIGVMFYARIVLKQDAPGGGLAKLVVSLANAAKAASEQSSPEYSQQYCIVINYKNGSSSNPYRYNSQTDALNAKHDYDSGRYPNIASVSGPYQC